jgi:hypothetical protein
MKAYGETYVLIHILLILALVGAGWSASSPFRFTPGERVPITRWLGGWVGPRAGLDDIEKSEFCTIPGLEPPGQWLRHYAGSRNVTGSGPDGVNDFYLFTKSFQLHKVLGFTQRLAEWIPEAEMKKCFWRVMVGHWIRLTSSPPSVSRLSRRSRILNIPQSYIGFHHMFRGNKQTNKKKPPWPLVRKRTIPTEQPPLVDEIEC